MNGKPVWLSVCNYVASGYGHEELTYMGKLLTTIGYNDRRIDTEMVLLHGNGWNLLSSQDSEKLGIVEFQGINSSSQDSVNQVVEDL